jgi:hypothetical protein
MYRFSDGEYSQIAGITDKLQYGYATFDEEKIYINTSHMVTNAQDAKKYAIYIYNYQGELIDTVSTGDAYSDNDLNLFSLVASSSDKVIGMGTSSEQITYAFGNTQYFMDKMIFFYTSIPNHGKGLTKFY